MPTPMNAAADFVDRHVEQGRGEKIALIDASSGERLTYAGLLDLVNRMGNVLKSLGVRREERVMLLLPDSIPVAASFFGAIKIGAVPVPTNTLLTPAEYAHLLEDSRARVLIIHASLLPRIEEIRPACRYLEHVVQVGGEGKGSEVDYEDAIRAASAELLPAPMSPDDACFWLYSSGTTGSPKGTVHLQHDMAVAAEQYAVRTLGLLEDDITFSVAKLFFAYGLGNGLYFPLHVGATSVLLPDKPDPELVFRVIEERRPTLFFSVPTGYAGMLSRHELGSAADLASVRRCVSAGEALPSALYDRWQEAFGVEILDGIGSTEILHIFISNRPGRVRPGSSGELVPGYEARLLDEQGNPVRDGEMGDLLIKGDSVCAGYWNRHEATKDTIEGHFIRTGDKYIRDAEGYFWYQGRGDDMLKVGGMWVSPVEVEGVLAQHPAVLESAVVGVPDAEGLVKPKAYVVLKDPSKGHDAALAQELQEFVKRRMAPYKYPRSIEFVPELPKTATGKTQRFRLRVRRVAAESVSVK